MNDQDTDQIDHQIVEVFLCRRNKGHAIQQVDTQRERQRRRALLVQTVLQRPQQLGNLKGKHLAHARATI